MSFGAQVKRYEGDQEVRAAQNDVNSLEFALGRAKKAERAAIANREKVEEQLAEARARLAEVTGELN